MGRVPMKLDKLTEKEKEEFYKAFASKARKFDKIPDKSSIADKQFGLVDDGTNHYLVYRIGDKVIKIQGTVV